MARQHTGINVQGVAHVTDQGNSSHDFPHWRCALRQATVGHIHSPQWIAETARINRRQTMKHSTRTLPLLLAATLTAGLAQAAGH